jgi:hypothetical protein
MKGSTGLGEGLTHAYVYAVCKVVCPVGHDRLLHFSTTERVSERRLQSAFSYSCDQGTARRPRRPASNTLVTYSSATERNCQVPPGTLTSIRRRGGKDTACVQHFGWVGCVDDFAQRGVVDTRVALEHGERRCRNCIEHRPALVCELRFQGWQAMQAQ